MASASSRASAAPASCRPARRGAHRNNRRTRPWPAPHRSRCRSRGWRSEISGPSFRARSRARSSRLFCQTASIVSLMVVDAADLRQRLPLPHAAPASASAGARSAPARPWRAQCRRRAMRRSRRRDPARGRARRARLLGARSGRRASGDCGNATSNAASPNVSRRGSLPK